MNTLRKATPVRAAAVLLIVLIGVLGVVPPTPRATARSAANESTPATNNTSGARSYFVDDKNGNDGNSGMSLDQPLKTIGKAAEKAEPGDVVFIRGGTYRETISMNKSGTAEAPITFTAYNNEQVTVSGATKVTGWADAGLAAPDGKPIYRAAADAPTDTDLKPENYQVFVDGKMVNQAREPEMADHDGLRAPFSQHWLETIMTKAVVVHIRTDGGQWISAANGGGGDVSAPTDVATPGRSEEFYLIDRDGGVLKSGDSVGFLTGSHKHYLAANIGGCGHPNDVLKADRITLDEWETFTIERVVGTGAIGSGDKVTFKLYCESDKKWRYLTADTTTVACGGGQIHANAESPGDCGKFALVINSVAVNLQALGNTAKNNYVRAVNGGGGIVDAEAVVSAAGARFYLIDKNGGLLESGDEVGFLTNSRRHYLAANIGGCGHDDDVLVANRTAFGEWETFTIERVAGAGMIASGDKVTFKLFCEPDMTWRYLRAEKREANENHPADEYWKVYANSTDVGDDEKFAITLYPEPVVVYDENDANDQDTDGDGRKDFEDIHKADGTWAGSYLLGSFEKEWSLSLAKISNSTPGILTLASGKEDVDNRWYDKTYLTGHIAIIGGLAALDSPYEWHYVGNSDGKSGYLYFVPPANTDPNRMSIEFRQKTWSLISGFETKDGKLVPSEKTSHLIFRNMEFYAGQLMIHGDHNVLDNVSILYGSHYAYRTSLGPDKDAALGINGAYIVGNDNTIENSEVAYSAANGITMEGDRNIVRNCLIHDFGYMGPYSSGVYFMGKGDGKATGSQLIGSTLFNSGRDLLHLGHCSGCRIVYNLFHDSTLLTDDSAPIYSWGSNLQGTEVAYNWVIGDTNPDRALSEFHLGIYLDTGTRNVAVHHNVIAGIGIEPGVGTNTPHEGNQICNNTVIPDRLETDENGVKQEPKKISQKAACSCFEKNTVGFDTYFQSLIVKNPEVFAYANQCGINPVYECDELPAEPKSGETVNCSPNELTYRCANTPGPNREYGNRADKYWRENYLVLENNSEFPGDVEAAQDLVRPEIVIAENGWQLLSQPDFRPKAGSSLIDAGVSVDGCETGDKPDIGAYESDGPNWIPGYSPVPRIRPTDEPEYVSAGGISTCALTSNGAVDCWGSDYYGQAQDQPGLYSQVSVGTYHTCALTLAGAVDCWGGNFDGQAQDQPGPYTRVSAGHAYTCALTPAGEVDCWGDSYFGQATDQRGFYTQLSAGSLQTCAITSVGTVDCWGSYGHAADQNNHHYVQVDTGAVHNCALTSSGAVDCWGGDNDFGEADDQPGPYIQVSVGDYHTCALTPAGAVDCWGWNRYGEADDRAGPYTQVSAGDAHTCAVTPTGSVDCWGDNTYGQATNQPGPYRTACSQVDGNVVENFCFLDGERPWRSYPPTEARFQLSPMRPFAGEFAAEIRMRGSSHWLVPVKPYVQFYQTGLALEPNTPYELSFAAYSHDGRDMRVWVHQHRSPYVNYGLAGQRIGLGRSWKLYTLTFTTPNLTEMESARLRFSFWPFATGRTIYHIDRVALRPVSNP